MIEDDIDEEIKRLSSEYKAELDYLSQLYEQEKQSDIEPEKLREKYRIFLNNLSDTHNVECNIYRHLISVVNENPELYEIFDYSNNEFFVQNIRDLLKCISSSFYRSCFLSPEQVPEQPLSKLGWGIYFSCTKGFERNFYQIVLTDKGQRISDNYKKIFSKLESVEESVDVDE